jgi:hypothetical protein
VAKPIGSKNFGPEEGQRLAELASHGLSKAEAGKALGRSYWTVRRHSAKLGIAFAKREPKPRISKAVARPDLAEARARRRRLEDGLIHELAGNGWSQGMAALELDLDPSVLWRHSRRLGVTWTRYPKRSMRGAPVSGLAELRRLRAKVRRLSLNHR